jgi:hypothetical protein
MMGGRYDGNPVTLYLHDKEHLHAKCRIDVINVNCMRIPQRFRSAWS